MQSAFDIYLGVPGGNTKLLASASDFIGAQKHMEKLAAQTPGPYFIVNTWSFCVLSRMNTQSKASVEPEPEFSMAT